MKYNMASRYVEQHIKYQEAVLFTIRELINEKGETTNDVQTVIDEALDELNKWYEMRNIFD